MRLIISRPGPQEYAPYYERYISLVSGEDGLRALQSQIEETAPWLARLPSEIGSYRYEAGKWTVREVLGHMIDAERVFAYRALRFSRKDATPLPGFEQDDFIREGPYETCTVKDLAEEFSLVRKSTLCLFRNMNQDILNRTGSANGDAMSTRAAAWVIAGHELHHMSILRDRYQPKRNM